VIPLHRPTDNNATICGKVLIVLLLAVVLNISIIVNVVYSIPTNQCIAQNCAQPTVNDAKLIVQLVTKDIDAPTNMAFLDNNDILVLERFSGKVKRIMNNTLESLPLLDVNVAAGAGERGLLGVAVSKNTEHTFIFLYFTESEFDGGKPIGNRLYRYELINNQLLHPKLLLDLPYSPGPYHNGGSITIGPDDNIYLTIGDLDNVDDRPRPNTLAQNAEDGVLPNGSGGILRITQNGDIVHPVILGNTYPLSLYYAYGIRNSYGNDFDPVTGKLWDTENGPNYGDEINLVEPGFNGGWKKVQGIWQLRGSNMGVEVSGNPDGLVDFDGNGKYSMPEFTWKGRHGPTAIKFLESDKLGKDYENDPFVGDIHNGTLYHFEMNETRTGLLLEEPLDDRIANNTEELNKIIFGQGFGGITDLEVGDDGYLYVLSYVHGSLYRISPNKE
jgi:glucose/arabinose dehydrogenase